MKELLNEVRSIGDRGGSLGLIMVHLRAWERSDGRPVVLMSQVLSGGYLSEAPMDDVLDDLIKRFGTDEQVPIILTLVPGSEMSKREPWYNKLTWQRDAKQIRSGKRQLQREKLDHEQLAELLEGNLPRIWDESDYDMVTAQRGGPTLLPVADPSAISSAHAQSLAQAATAKGVTPASMALDD